MPTLKVLISNKLVDAELVVHEGSLVPKVPDAFVGSTLPLLTSKLESKGQVADLLFEVGDLVQGAEKRFPGLYGKEAAKDAKDFAKDYKTARETFDAGEFEEAKEKASALKGQIQSSMVSLELKGMVAKETKKKTKSKKVKVSRRGKEELFEMAARFDGSRLRAKLLGAEGKEPVGELLEIPKGAVKHAEAAPSASINSSSSCSCDCTPPSIDEMGSVGYLVTIRRFKYGSLDCTATNFYGDSTDNFKTTSCSVQETPSIMCEKIRRVFFPEGS